MSRLQKTYYKCNIYLIVGILIAIYGCAGRPAPRPKTTPPAPPAVRKAPEKPVSRTPPSSVPKLEEPVIRVGLKTDVKSAILSSTDALFFQNGGKAGRVEGRVITAISFAPDVSTRYSVQVGSFGGQPNAAQAQQGLRSKTKHPSYVFENREMSLFQLRVGPFSTQEIAGKVADELRGSGYAGAFVVTESSALSQMPELLVRDEFGNLLRRTRDPVYFWSANQLIDLDGAPYRGQMIVFVNKIGRLTVVNRLHFEDYLKGVVPNEIGSVAPTTYEAQKAQAVAARTYAHKNLRQFDADGYDICPTPRCQVYSGFKTENDLTSRAVEDTAGQILTFAGEPINALYTSTCGGKTENAEFMFEGWNYSYLKSVECYPEETEITKKAIQIRGAAKPWWLSWIELKMGRSIQGGLEKRIGKTEIEQEVASLLSYLGKSPCSSAPLIGTSQIAVADYLVQQLCWQSKKDSLFHRKDFQYFATRLGLALSTENDSLLLMIHEEIMNPGTDAQRIRESAGEAMTRSSFYETLFQILKHYRQINTRDGLIRETDGRQFQIVDEQGVHTVSIQQPVFLYQKLGEQRTPKDALVCGVGDNVEYYDEQSIRIFVCEVSRTGIAFDRGSKFTFWQVPITPAELSLKVNKYLDVGEVIDVKPLTYGVSGRVFEMSVTGTKTSGVLKGIRVRWALGLRDNLFTIDRVLDRSGKVKQFVFTGRGWGHGVGMCQVGALGLSKRGRNYSEILKHYYSGVQIQRVY